MFFVHVRCRTGSLEIHEMKEKKKLGVRCRTGSLEMIYCQLYCPRLVRCRTGSLEISQALHVV